MSKAAQTIPLFFVAEQKVDMLQSLNSVPEGAVLPVLLCALVSDPKFALWHRRRESWSLVYDYRPLTRELEGKLV